MQELRRIPFFLYDGVGMGLSITYSFSRTLRGLAVAAAIAHAAIFEGPAILTIIAETNMRILSIGALSC